MGKSADFFDLNSEVSLSAGHDRMVVFARRESGELAHISEVDNGKACGCFCLACQEALIARQGPCVNTPLRISRARSVSTRWTPCCTVSSTD